MKTNRFIAIIALGIAAAACSPKEQQATEQTAADTETAGAPKPVDAKDLLPSKATIDTVSYLLGINFGSFIQSYDFGDKLNYSQIVKGMKDFMNAEGNQQDPEFVNQFKINPDLMNGIFNNFLGNRVQYKTLINKEKGDAFLKEDAKKEGMVTSASGLQYRIADPGNDIKPTFKDTVWVHYKGTLIDGTVFDECAPDQDPIHFTLDRVIRGWSEGMTYIGEGGKIELYVPAELGYGEQGTRGIEPNSVLIFNVELTKVGKFVVEAAE